MLETFEGRRAHLEQDFALSAPVPDAVREEWGIALDYYALAVEQANIDRGRLFGPLTRDSLLRSANVLEMALRDRMHVADGATTLHRLVERAIKTELVPGPLPLTKNYKKEHPEEVGNIWDLIIEVRNQYAHGHPDKPTFGPSSTALIRFVWRMLETIYAPSE